MSTTGVLHVLDRTCLVMLDAMGRYRGSIPLRSAATTPPENLISGRIFQDLSNDCVQQPGEPALPNLLVGAEPGGAYGITDDNGIYTLAVDTGRYTVRQLLPPTEPGRSIRELCAGVPTVALAGYGNVVSGPDFGNQVSLAPQLKVSVASNRRRRCFRNSTAVSYVNAGFAASAAATVTVALPAQVVLVQADVAHTRDAAGNYVFQVGALQPNQRGVITIVDSVVCGSPALRGLTVCTRAWIRPATRLLVRVPAGAQSGLVQVQTPGGQALTATSLHIIPAPVITGLIPTHGPVGTAVIITGRNFGEEGLADTIALGGRAVRVLRATATSAEVLIPRGAGTGLLSTAGAGGRAQAAGPFGVSTLPLSEAVAVYPTPTRADVTISWHQADFVVQQVRLYNALGALVATQAVGPAAADELTIPLAHCQPGMYLVVVDTPAGRVVRRISLL